jgi:ribonuclease VapC
VIVVDTSALVAILRSEPLRAACLDALERYPSPFISAGTLVECFIVAEDKGVGGRMRSLIDALQPEIILVDQEFAYQAHMAFRQWGKGRHPAALNFGDCFSYVAAKQKRASLLFIGNDFSQTDIESVL